MTTYRTLESEGVAIPVSLLFAESEAALALRDWLRAYTALGEYLARADATDPLYSDALRRFTGVETKALEVAEGRDREMQLAAAAELKAIDEQKKADVARFVDALFADLVVVPAGKFRMGDVSGKGEADERPLRNVSIAAFRLGRYEVTFAQFDRFCAATGRKPPDDNGWGREQRPVINVSWDDAIAYHRLAQRAERTYVSPAFRGRMGIRGPRRPRERLLVGRRVQPGVCECKEHRRPRPMARHRACRTVPCKSVRPLGHERQCSRVGAGLLASRLFWRAGRRSGPG